MQDDHHMSEVRKALEAFPEVAGPDRRAIDLDFLRTMYQVKSQQFLSDNGRIWSTAALLIPLSLAPFGLAIGNGRNAAQLLLLAFASVLLVGSWLLIAEAHRNFQNASLNWMIGIEEVFGVHEHGGMVKAADPSRLSRYMDRPQAVRKFRVHLFSLICVAWFVVFALHFTGTLGGD
jgi:hypothetical protein